MSSKENKLYIHYEKMDEEDPRSVVVGNVYEILIGINFILNELSKNIDIPYGELVGELINIQQARNDIERDEKLGSLWDEF